MRSEKIGDLFERATLKILREIFDCWGYTLVDSKIQKSGSQHGFDVCFKITKGHSTLNVYVECKASKELNTINSNELIQKVIQLNWAGFPDKDIHLFLSLTRSISFNNEQISIEDDSYPFVVIDWMRKENEDNLILELFAAYASYGSDQDILLYSDFLFSNVPPLIHSPRPFMEVCEQLKSKFEKRVTEHSAKTRHDGYSIINGVFWAEIQQETHLEAIHYYYTKTDSTPARLREVVANNVYIKNEVLDKQFSRTLEQAIREKSVLVKILSKGGEGKSTFLYHIAKSHYNRNIIVWLEDLRPEILSGIEKHIQRSNTDKPILFILDNAAVFGKSLKEFAQKLTLKFRRYNLVFVLAEREFRYRNIEDINTFEAVFNEIHQIDYKSRNIKDQIFYKLISFLQVNKTLSEEIKREAKHVFLEDKRRSIAESTFAVIKYLKFTDQLRGYSFDWEDWEKFAQNYAPKLDRLYLILSTFYQFGYTLDIEFCTLFIKDVDFIDINTVLSDNPNLPIYKRGRHLLLRHESLATWYLDGSDAKNKVNRENSEKIFKIFLDNINTSFAKDLFIWLCLKNKEFQYSYLAKYVTDKRRLSILENFILQNERELKCRTELSKIYQRQKKWADAIRLLKEYISLDPEGLHPRTELSKIYQRQKKFKEAEDILLELKDLDPENLQARTELSKIYQRQKKFKEAEDILLELKDLDPENLQARTELSKIYQRQKKFKEAEDILLELKDLDPENLQARTELSKIYQRQKKFKEAEDILLELKDLDPENLQARTELSKIYQQQKKFKEAEDILLELKDLDPENLQARTELSKIYQQQKKFKEAEDILLESLSIDPEQLHPRTELSKIYQRQKKFKEAEDILLELKDLDPENLQARTELSKIYQRQKKFKEAEKLLLECLEIDPYDLNSRTELSKLYQNKGRCFEAEKLLHECLSINPDDPNSLLELGKICSRDVKRYTEAEMYFQHIFYSDPTNLYAKIELARLYYKMGKYQDREEILFEIYDTYPEDIPTLMELARLFMRFKKYRIAVNLLNNALELRNSDLITLSKLIKLHATLRDNQAVRLYLKKSLKILKHDPHNKHAERFKNVKINLDEEVSLLDLNKAGLFILSNDQKYVESSTGRYMLNDHSTFNYNLADGDKVYFAIYRKEGKVFANFVEPYFENINHLDQLK